MIDTITRNKIKKKRILYPLLFILLAGIIAFNVYDLTSSPDKVKPYRVTGGWGYQILHENMVYVDQPFIPLFAGRKPFPTRKSAVKTGKIMLKRLKQKQIPVITRDDLYQLGIDTLDIRQ